MIDALRSGRDEDVICLGFAKGEMVTANFDFERIAERCGADEGDGCAGEQAHFAEAKKCRTQLRKFADGRFGTHGELREWDRGRVRREWSGSVGHGGGDAVRGAAGWSKTLPYFWANGSTRMWLAAAWLRAIRVPLTWHRIVVVPETFVTQEDSPNPISRTRWQK